ncbi:MAG: hypothetical protein N3J91_10005 [Verrucomicrobiae bacterium]|nr:hypothetical protein [Verrucomicrobiae bacterium]
MKTMPNQTGFKTAKILFITGLYMATTAGYACFQLQGGASCTTGTSQLARVENACVAVEYLPRESSHGSELYAVTGKENCTVISLNVIKTVTWYRILDGYCSLEVVNQIEIPTGERCAQGYLDGDECTM